MSIKYYEVVYNKLCTVTMNVHKLLVSFNPPLQKTNFQLQMSCIYPSLRTQFSIAEELFIQGGDSLFFSPSKEATPLDLEKAIFHCRRVVFIR
jgi:hypothetical protein